MNELMRQLPPIHEIQKHERFLAIKDMYNLSQDQLTVMAKEVVAHIRKAWLNTSDSECTLAPEQIQHFIIEELEKKVKEFSAYSLQRVINGTGTILHTNLGRAKLSEEAIDQVVLVARNYSNLEYNIESGTRGSRHDIIEKVIKTVTGAEAAMVVNNNAAAVYLILKALAKEKEVIVSRGELVEIGGSFRVSAIMEESGATLVEVGTTNKTHSFDYEEAITEQTAMIMKVHTSNFKTIGFTASVPLKNLTSIKKDHPQVLLYEDLGSGALLDFRDFHIGEEPTVKEALGNGADIVSFSGDKLLGGPQAGIIAGKKAIIQRLKKHQLARVLRVDKMTLAALEATLKAYTYSDEMQNEIPTVKAILESKSSIQKRAMQFLEKGQGLPFHLKLEEGTSQIGGGTMPGVELGTFLVSIARKGWSAQRLFNELRLSEPSIVTRIIDEKVHIDLRTITEEEVDIIITTLQHL
ncbi:L-seryl-tRNA(Sec) selenium transferase [Alkalihalobacterium chitinilyticum]|uniref:L-seryl-tRNA(Sec) selenium transferase n=1 Tax=Alkalihalobacterium chitinilyticum TaxID=2980103 RepID=A0ABT5VDN7_9BACI|nr:L-seryl-tRNA(Sec) selenium transferase [Alkalihalobacterium chitinilyticum]MDE5412842.1 L-seryl-tRNA(Sec) selenium transferase [Alkalihalobacterium chitinilyticum]